jgi:predicted esterase
MEERRVREVAGRGRLAARPGANANPAPPGMHRLGLDDRRDALLFVPSSIDPAAPAPFVLSLHGAGGDAEGGFYPLRAFADEFGLVILAPASRGRTWDAVLGEVGPDVAFLDRALAAAFGRVRVDPARLAVAGFSDGASAALSLGLANGDLFGRIVAFSPGFAAPKTIVDAPRVFVSHGVRDEVLPIDPCSRRLVPRLRDNGYDVTYLEFDGGHDVPDAVARRAAAWLLDEGVATPGS